MTIFWIFVAIVIVAFVCIVWSYVDDLKKADEYYPSLDDLNKLFDDKAK
jgi:hypothetical protein